jgi:hypothetical protein
MTATADAPSATHPIVGFARAVGRGLDRVGQVEPVFMTTSEKKAALLELHSAEQRLTALRMRVMAVADDVAEETGARDAGAWLAHHTRTERGTSTSALRLGEALEQSWKRLGQALGEGRVNLEQARVIHRALSELPTSGPHALEPETLVKAEEHLIDLAADYRPRELARLGRHILEVVAPEIAEAEEGRRLDKEERRARETTSLHTKRLGDGSTRISIKVPDAVADRLATYLDAFTSPRHDFNDGSTGPEAVQAGPGVFGRPSATIPDADRLPMHRKRGHAFAALLERLDPATVPEHGGDATTVLVTIGLEQLRKDLAAADLLTSDEGSISASEARRLACNASIVPVVLGTEGQVLDLGRSSRLYNKPQRKAMRLRDKRCRAEGCTVPAGWCDAHHWDPWSSGGRTDLDSGVLLCNWHHHRVHDNRYRASRLPNGDVRFSRRT